jgi:hypothetical protein
MSGKTYNTQVQSKWQDAVLAEIMPIAIKPRRNTNYLFINLFKMRSHFAFTSDRPTTSWEGVRAIKQATTKICTKGCFTRAHATRFSTTFTLSYSLTPNFWVNGRV